MKTSEIFKELANRYEAWGNYEKCTCSDKMYFYSYIMEQVALAFEKYENGEELPQYFEKDTTEELRLIEELMLHTQQIL